MENYERQVTIDRFEGTSAVLVFDDGKEIIWPIKNLPAEVKEGAVLRLTVSNEATAEEERRKLAKELINEILEK
ncbi:MAG: DUF3006 domain-containing protein [Patescibacteria group bacterium]|nr:DUF3006 domain-containing protein [Patescibacteria group bacterium]